MIVGAKVIIATGPAENQSQTRAGEGSKAGVWIEPAVGQSLRAQRMGRGEGDNYILAPQAIMRWYPDHISRACAGSGVLHKDGEGLAA
jgi:hypothetical protein